MNDPDPRLARRTHLPVDADEQSREERLYDDLKRAALAGMRTERAGHTLQPTAVAHEAWLRLRANAGPEGRDRSLDSGLVAKVVRRVLVDHARKHHALKRGQGVRPERLTESLVVFEEHSVNLLDLDAALVELATRSTRQARVVELRFFSGLDIDGTAEVLNLSRDTVKRDWRLARAWLNKELGEGGPGK